VRFGTELLDLSRRSLRWPFCHSSLDHQHNRTELGGGGIASSHLLAEVDRSCPVLPLDLAYVDGEDCLRVNKRNTKKREREYGGERQLTSGHVGVRQSERRLDPTKDRQQPIRVRKPNRRDKGEGNGGVGILLFFQVLQILLAPLLVYHNTLRSASVERRGIGKTPEICFESRHPFLSIYITLTQREREVGFIRTENDRVVGTVIEVDQKSVRNFPKKREEEERELSESYLPERSRVVSLPEMVVACTKNKEERARQSKRQGIVQVCTLEPLLDRLADSRLE
jgi:hypothetical protein